ncbi:MAG: hypothetical protein UHS32_02165, partial [Bacteroidaceae bacterium]|nr:hypothetical protein [Bacteroidaceae bacterium]
MNNLLKRIVILLLLFCPMASQAKKFKQEVIHSCTGEQVRIYSSAVTDTLRIFVIADTHLWLSDEREAPFRQYSKRMAAAYNETTHFKTGEKTNPEKAFRQTVALAKAKNADVIALL